MPQRPTGKGRPSRRQGRVCGWNPRLIAGTAETGTWKISDWATRLGGERGKDAGQ